MMRMDVEMKEKVNLKAVKNILRHHNLKINQKQQDGILNLIKVSDVPVSLINTQEGVNISSPRPQ
jgi:hypothetical protein